MSLHDTKMERGAGNGASGEQRKGTRFYSYITGLSLARGVTPTVVGAQDVQQSRRKCVDRNRGGKTITDHIGNSSTNDKKRLASFKRNIFAAGPSSTGAVRERRGNIRGPLSRSTEESSLLVDGVVGCKSDSLTDEEVRAGRERCMKMLAAAEAAGGPDKGADARKALLDKVFETHPGLDKKEIETYLNMRGLNIAGDVEPMRIRELAVALFCLCRPKALTFDSLVRVAFSMFDQNCDGEMDKAEFQQLVKATLAAHLTLDFVLRSPAGKEAFLRHLKEEFAEENFHFWQSSEQFASSLPTVPKAQTLYDCYIREGAPKQVNISAATNERIRKKWRAVRNGEKPLTKKIFAAAQAEVFSLMERDNFERFRSNARSMQDFMDCVFQEVDFSNDGSISLEEYLEWAKKTREAVGFMRDAGGTFFGVKNRVPYKDNPGKSSKSRVVYRRSLHSVELQEAEAAKRMNVIHERDGSCPPLSVPISRSLSSAPSPRRSLGGSVDGSSSGSMDQGYRHNHSGGGGSDGNGARIGEPNTGKQLVGADLRDDATRNGRMRPCHGPGAAYSSPVDQEDSRAAPPFVASAAASGEEPPRTHGGSGARQCGWGVTCSDGNGEGEVSGNDRRFECGDRKTGEGRGSYTSNGGDETPIGDNEAASAAAVGTRRRQHRPKIFVPKLSKWIVQGKRWAGRRLFRFARRVGETPSLSGASR